MIVCRRRNGNYCQQWTKSAVVENWEELPMFLCLQPCLNFTHKSRGDVSLQFAFRSIEHPI